MESRFEFGHRLPGQAEAKILAALVAANRPLSRRDISAVFGRNAPHGVIATALERLYDAGKVEYELVPTAGRSRQEWRLKESLAEESR